MAEEAQTTPTESPQVTIVDLQNAIHIIDIACERGAFKGGEMSSIGGVRDKIATFVEFAVKTEEAAAAASNPAPEAE